jgi:hypothetical protein
MSRAACMDNFGALAQREQAQIHCRSIAPLAQSIMRVDTRMITEFYTTTVWAGVSASFLAFSEHEPSTKPSRRANPCRPIGTECYRQSGDHDCRPRMMQAGQLMIRCFYNSFCIARTIRAAIGRTVAGWTHPLMHC